MTFKAVGEKLPENQEKAKSAIQKKRGEEESRGLCEGHGGDDRVDVRSPTKWKKLN